MVWFSVCTAIVGLFNMAAAGQITLANFSVDEIPGQITVGTSQGIGTGSAYTEAANTATGSNLSGIDFTTETVLNPNITYTKGIGTWTLVNGKGLVLTSSPLNLINGIYLTNVMSVGNTYTVNAKINNNEAGGDFTIYPRYASGTLREDVKLVFSSDGIHLKKSDITFGLLDPGDDYFYPMPNARDTISGGSTITTILTEIPTADVFGRTSPLTVIKDGNVLFNITVSSLYSLPYSNWVTRHGGVESGTQNFIVMGFPNTQIKDTAAELYSGSGAAEQLNPMGAIGQFLALVGIIMGLAGNAPVPFWLWAILTGCPIATLIYMNLELLRGT